MGYRCPILIFACFLGAALVSYSQIRVPLRQGSFRVPAWDVPKRHVEIPTLETLLSTMWVPMTFWNLEFRALTVL